MGGGWSMMFSIPALPGDTTGIIIQQQKPTYVGYITFWRDPITWDWDIEYRAQNTHSQMCEKRGDFRECTGCIHRSTKCNPTECTLQSYQVPEEVVEMATAGAIACGGNGLSVYYTTEDPSVLRYWEISAIVGRAKELTL